MAGPDNPTPPETQRWSQADEENQRLGIDEDRRLLRLGIDPDQDPLIIYLQLKMRIAEIKAQKAAQKKPTQAGET
jgi:hypothetical protein